MTVTLLAMTLMTVMMTAPATSMHQQEWNLYSGMPVTLMTRIMTAQARRHQWQQVPLGGRQETTVPQVCHWCHTLAGNIDDTSGTAVSPCYTAFSTIAMYVKYQRHHVTHTGTSSMYLLFCVTSGITMSDHNAIIMMTPYDQLKLVANLLQWSITKPGTR